MNKLSYCPHCGKNIEKFRVDVNISDIDDKIKENIGKFNGIKMCVNGENHFPQFITYKPENNIENVINEAIKDSECGWAPLNFEGSGPISGFGIAEIDSGYFELPIDSSTSMRFDVDERSCLVLAGMYFNKKRLWFKEPVFARSYCCVEVSLKNTTRYFSHDPTHPVDYIGFIGYCIGKIPYLLNITGVDDGRDNNIGNLKGVKIKVNDISYYPWFVNQMPEIRIKGSIDKAVNDAESNWAPLKYEGSSPINGFGISDLHSEHFGVWEWSLDHMKFNVDERAYLILTGMFFGNQRLWFREPLVVDPYSRMEVDLQDYVKYFIGDKPVNYIGFMGHCIGKRAYLISITEKKECP